MQPYSYHAVKCAQPNDFESEYRPGIISHLPPLSAPQVSQQGFPMGKQGLNHGPSFLMRNKFIFTNYCFYKIPFSYRMLNIKNTALEADKVTTMPTDAVEALRNVQFLVLLVAHVFILKTSQSISDMKKP